METQETSFKIEINGKNATKDLTPFILSIGYTDNLSGKADELCIEVDNSDFRFFNDWFFVPGMVVKAWIGQMYCGQFMIDEPGESGPPHIAEFKAQSAEFSGPIRTKKSFSHHAKSLKDIVQKYADDHKLKVVGTIPDLNLNTVIQMETSDIDFLHNLAHKYGCICSVKGGNLVFDSLENIWKRDTVKTINFADVKSYRFNTSLPETTDGAVSIFDDPYEGKKVGAAVTSKDVSSKPSLLSNYTFLNHYQYTDQLPGGFKELDADYNPPNNKLVIKIEKAESNEEGKRIAYGSLLNARNKKHRCSITVPGNELLVAGNTVKVLGFGKRSGFWLIEKSSHKLTKGGGFLTTIDIVHGGGTNENKQPEDKPIKPEINAGGGGGTPEYFEKNQA